MERLTNFGMFAGITALAIGLGSLESVSAAQLTESGDAGELIPTAQLLPGGIDSVVGGIASDRDLYGFNWGGGNLALEVISASFDSQLFVFDSLGEIIGANDDGGVGLLSLLSGNLTSGLYYVGIGAFNSDPLNSFGQDIEDPLGGGSSTAFQPGQCGLSLTDCTLSSWRSNRRSGDYTVRFSSPTIAADVPTPALLPGLVGMGAALIRKRKQEAS
ncbi:PTPA-CTERM sorting domain-containing protein [Leptothoe sp. EHU-05/26/07-4]